MTNKSVWRRVVAFVLALSLTLTFVPTITAQAAKKYTVNNVKDYYAISTDVTLGGTGTGYHAKIGYVVTGAAFSFGIQHDEFASAPYTGLDTLMVENVYSNDPGGQRYEWLATLTPGKKYNLMLSLSKAGDLTVYLDGKALKTYKNKGLKTYNGSDIQKYLANPQARVEGAGRLNGDTVNAKFSNIVVKEGKYRNGKKYTSTNKYAEDVKRTFFMPQKFITNPTLKVTEKKNTVKVTGSISGLPAGMDWDSAYEDVSGLVQFQRDAQYFPPKGYKDHK